MNSPPRPGYRRLMPPRTARLFIGGLLLALVLGLGLPLLTGKRLSLHPGLPSATVAETAGWFGSRKVDVSGVRVAVVEPSPHHAGE